MDAVICPWHTLIYQPASLPAFRSDSIPDLFIFYNSATKIQHPTTTFSD